MYAFNGLDYFRKSRNRARKSPVAAEIIETHCSGASPKRGKSDINFWFVQRNVFGRRMYLRALILRLNRSRITKRGSKRNGCCLDIWETLLFRARRGETTHVETFLSQNTVLMFPFADAVLLYSTEFPYILNTLDHLQRPKIVSRANLRRQFPR